MRFLMIAAMSLGMVGTAWCANGDAFKCTVADFRMDSPGLTPKPEFMSDSRSQLFEVFDTGDAYRMKTASKTLGNYEIEYRIMNRGPQSTFAIEENPKVALDTFTIDTSSKALKAGKTTATVGIQLPDTVYVWYLTCNLQ